MRTAFVRVLTIRSIYNRYKLDDSTAGDNKQRYWSRRMAQLNFHTRRVRLIRPWIQLRSERIEDEHLNKIVLSAARALLKCAVDLSDSGAPLVRGT